MSPKARSDRTASPSPPSASPKQQPSHDEPPLSLSVQRAMASPLSASPAQLLQLQRLIGNRAVSTLVQRAQATREQPTRAPTAKETIQRLPVYLPGKHIIETSDAGWDDLQDVMKFAKEEIQVVVGHHSKSFKPIMRPATDQEWEEIIADYKAGYMRQARGLEKGYLDTAVDTIKDTANDIVSSPIFSGNKDGDATRQNKSVDMTGYAATGMTTPNTLGTVAGYADQYAGIAGNMVEPLSQVAPPIAIVGNSIAAPLNLGKGVSSTLAVQSLEALQNRNWHRPELGAMMPHLLEWKSSKERRSYQAAACGTLAVGGLATAATGVGLIPGMVASGVGTLGSLELMGEKLYGWVKHGTEDETPDQIRHRYAFTLLRLAQDRDPRTQQEARAIMQALGLSKKVLFKDGQALPGAEELLVSAMASW